MRAVFFGDVPQRLAGAQRSLLASLSSIREHGVEPILIFPSEGIFVAACREARLPVRILPGPPAFETFGQSLLRLSAAGQADVVVRQILPYVRRLARLVDQEHAEVVHFNTPRGAIMAGLSASYSGRNAVMHLRGAPAMSRRYWLLAQTLVDWFVLVARFLQTDLLPSVRSRSRVVHNGITPRPTIARDLARRTLAKRIGLPELPNDVPVFVSLSSLVPFKGLHHLLAAAAETRRRGLDAHFVLAGTGLADAYEAWLRRRRDDLGLGDRAHFVGFVDDTHELLCGSEGLILPTVDREIVELDDGTRLDAWSSEGLPRSILEAMAAAIPVIATRVVGVPDQVEDGRSGVLIPPSDPRALADAIERVARDSTFRMTAGRRGQELVRARFTIHTASQGLAEVLAQAASQSPLSKPIRIAELCRDLVAEIFPSASAAPLRAIHPISSEQ